MRVQRAQRRPLVHHLGQHIAGAHRFPITHQPYGDRTSAPSPTISAGISTSVIVCPFGNCSLRSELSARHRNNLIGIRQKRPLHFGRERNGHIWKSDPGRRRAQGYPRRLADTGDDFGSYATASIIIVDNNEPTRLRTDCTTVARSSGASVRRSNTSAWMP